MPRPRNIAKIIGSLKLTESEKAVVRELLKVDPRVVKLQERREELAERLAAVESEIATATGGKVAKGKRERPAGSGKVAMVAAPKRRGRPVGSGKKKATPAQLAALARARAARMGKGAKSAKVAKPKKKRTPAEQAAINARMAKARAARGKAKG